MKSEQGRWYDPETGQCVLEIPKKDGKGTKRPNINDAIEHGWYPSVTTIAKVIAKDGLEIWKQRQVLMSALTTPRPAGMSDEEFVELILNDSKEQGEQAAERGKDFHAAANEYWKTGNMQNEDVAIANFLLELGAWRVKKEAEGWGKWDSESALICERLEYAGTPDLVGIRGDDRLIIDYKTTDIEKYKAPYDEWAMQIAANFYALSPHCALGSGNAWEELIVDRTTGRMIVHEWKHDDIKRGWRMFRDAISLWIEINRWEERKAKKGAK
jgi:hypothetical protein